MIDVFILEDNPATRAQLERSVDTHRELAHAGSADSVESARAWLRENTTDVALVDLDLPDGNGVEVIREFATPNHHPEFMVITVFGDDRHVIEAIEAGATGYLLKEREPEHISQSIVDLVNGGSPISPSIARHLLKRFREGSDGHDPAPSTPHLTQRESEVLNMVVKGFSYQEIADALDLSFHTVTSHIKHIYRKLSVRSRGEAVFEAIQLGIVDISTDRT